MCTDALAEDAALDKPGKEQKKSYSISPIIGVRYDVLQWSFPGVTVPKLSELTWKNKIEEYGIELLVEPEDNNLSFLGSVKYGRILDNYSTNQDSDWDKYGEFSKTFSKVKGNVFDLSAAAGVVDKDISKFPFASTAYYYGFDYNYNNNEDFGLNYKINRENNSLKLKTLGQTMSNAQLVSTYKYQMFAPWFGMKLNYKLSNKLEFSPFVKIYWFYYDAEADWKFSDYFRKDPSFRHKAIGVGASLDAELLYRIYDYLDIHAKCGIKKMSMSRGSNIQYWANGQIAGSELKDLTILTKTINIGLRYNF